MKKQGRTQLALGIILILLGAWFIAQRSIPEVAAFAKLFSDWPFTVIGVGALLLLLGLISGRAGLGGSSCDRGGDRWHPILPRLDG